MTSHNFLVKVRPLRLNLFKFNEEYYFMIIYIRYIKNNNECYINNFIYFDLILYYIF